jgi:hypothetical protein
MGMGCVNKPVSLFLRSKVRAGFDDLVCLPDQTHIRSSREATAPGFRLRREGSRGRDHSSLRHLKPSNPSVRPPGSAEADRASADWFCWLFSDSRRVPEVRAVLGGGFHRSSLDDDAMRDVLPQRDEQLARQRDGGALAASLAARAEPAGQRRFRLSRIGTNRTCRSSRCMSVVGAGADVICS